MTVINNDRETELDTAEKVLAHAFKDLLETRKDPATESRRKNCRRIRKGYAMSDPIYDAAREAAAPASKIHQAIGKWKRVK